MVAERLAMRTVREILRHYYAVGIRGSRMIGQSVDCSKSMVNMTLQRATAAGIASWSDISQLDDTELDRKLNHKAETKDEASRPLPNWAEIHRELKRADHQITLMLLWQEYREQHPDGYGYSRFTQLYREWESRISLVMRQEHKAGEKVFVDFCDGLGIADPKTGEISKTQLFIGALGASSYTYARAVMTQKIDDWIDCHCDMYEFFRGVTAITVPDNLKSGVRKADRYEAEPNSTYREMANHYGTCIIPARVRRPRDKAKAEANVLVAQRWILAALRNRSFYSLAEMNDAIAVFADVEQHLATGHPGLQSQAHSCPVAAQQETQPARRCNGRFGRIVMGIVGLLAVCPSKDNVSWTYYKRLTLAKQFGILYAS